MTITNIQCHIKQLSNLSSMMCYAQININTIPKSVLTETRYNYYESTFYEITYNLASNGRDSGFRLYQFQISIDCLKLYNVKN